jgi:hypothetical protein
MKPQRTLQGMNPGGHVLAKWLERHGRVLDGNVSFGSTMTNKDQEQNIECWKASGTTPATANTEFSVTHGLGRIPLTLAGWDTNNGGVIYRSTTAWTKTAVFLKCTTASAAYNIVLI